MNSEDDFENELKRMKRRNTILGVALSLLVLPLTIAIEAGVIFVVVGLAFGAIGWLFGAAEPREVAILAGGIAAGIAVIWEFVLIGIRK